MKGMVWVAAAMLVAGCAGERTLWDGATFAVDGFATATPGKDARVGEKDGTLFRCLEKDGEFLFRFDVKDPDVAVATEVKHPLDIANGDRVEVYFVPDAQMAKGYRCAEIDADGRVLSYSVDAERKNYDWFWKFATLKTCARRTADGYVVEGRVSLAELRSFGVDPSDFYLGVFRAQMRAPGAVSLWCSAAPAVVPAQFHQPAMLLRYRSAK